MFSHTTPLRVPSPQVGRSLTSPRCSASSWVKVSFISTTLAWSVSCREQPNTAQRSATTVTTNAATPGVGVAVVGETMNARPLASLKQVSQSATSDGERATVGKKAPAFELPELDGKAVQLSDYLGKVVVLEWFNPECPFVRAAHTKGSLVNVAERLQKQGVAYLAVNSAAVGKQGYGREVNRPGVENFHLNHPVLLDESGTVGKKYGATNTPHIFVIDRQGTLVYRGAVDNSPDGEGESPEGGKLVSFLDEAVTAVLAGKPVKTSETKAYGCSVKYGT